MTNGRSQSYLTAPRSSHLCGRRAIGLAAKSTILPIATAAGFWLTLSSSASAQQQTFGSRGQLAITAEEIFDLSTQTARFDVPNSSQQSSATSTRFGFLLSGRSGDVIPINGPKFGAHYFVTQSLSIGGSLGYESRGGSYTFPLTDNSSRNVDRGSSTTFVLSPKVGYALMFNPMMGFWFRGGITYAHVSTHTEVVALRDDAARASFNYWLLDFDAPFLFSPVPNLAFYLGPKLNFSFTGSAQFVNSVGAVSEAGTSFFNFSVNAGMLGHFYVW